MTKYNLFTSANNTSISDLLYEELVKTIEKSSSSSAKPSIQDEINAILGRARPKFSTVEEVVQDMKERTGLKAFLQSKKAFANDPEMFAQIPEMKYFIDNFVEDRPGTSVEAVIHDMFKIDSIRKLVPEDGVTEDVKKYISAQIDKHNENQNNNEINSHIGKIDQQVDVNKNDDPLAICEPQVE